MDNQCLWISLNLTSSWKWPAITANALQKELGNSQILLHLFNHLDNLHATATVDRRAKTVWHKDLSRHQQALDLQILNIPPLFIAVTLTLTIMITNTLRFSVRAVVLDPNASQIKQGVIHNLLERLILPLPRRKLQNFSQACLGQLQPRRDRLDIRDVLGEEGAEAEPASLIVIVGVPVERNVLDLRELI